MGQKAVGILYGCECPKFPPGESEEPEYDLICRWEKARKLDPFRECLRVRAEMEGGKMLLGVWVAVGGSGEDGAPYFLEECVPVGEIEERFARSMARAKKLWDRFAIHVAQKEGILLPCAQLWLTPCETA